MQFKVQLIWTHVSTEPPVSADWGVCLYLVCIIPLLSLKLEV